MLNPHVAMVLGLSEYHVNNLHWLLRMAHGGWARDRMSAFGLDSGDWCGELLTEVEQFMRLHGMDGRVLARTEDADRFPLPDHPLMGRADPFSPDRELFAVDQITYYRKARGEPMSAELSATQVHAELNAHHDGLGDKVAATALDPSTVLKFINEIIAIAQNPTVIAVVVNVVNFIVGLLPKKA